MSKYKKIVSTFMAILISLSIIYSTIPLASAKEFTDVSRKTLGDDFLMPSIMFPIMDGL